MHERKIGNRLVSAIGLGAMPMSIEGRPEPERAIATINAALDAGITLIDTANSYHRDAGEEGHNEELVARALRARGVSDDEVLVATKGGTQRPGDGSWTKNGRPERLKQAAKDSARRLGVEAIGLYQFHRPDPEVPFAESMGAIAELLDEGVIQMAGVSNTDVAQINEANDVLDGRLVSVQNQFSPRFRSSHDELEHCARLGIAFLPWSPLGGIAKAAELGSQHRAFADVAGELGVSVYQVTLAWELALADVVIPIPGASRPESIVDSAGAAEVRLSEEQMARLSAS
ncbi:aldo/keto reductase [Ruania alkalisoli]|uniref:Aldo/keto reductase n=1 Tax=Ruania alkalisoli TaxID=2779775 RepID=A0A7M1SVJ7_9MICO|nr:aldo/keto reductase [Ruania alkalisoli]QOR70782.1 aldo/keto reductase [Ruania alkalisoli]